jgi:hypothetical protein
LVLVLLGTATTLVLVDLAVGTTLDLEDPDRVDDLVGDALDLVPRRETVQNNNRAIDPLLLKSWALSCSSGLSPSQTMASSGRT